MDILIRNARHADFGEIVSLNKGAEQYTSPLDLARLVELDHYAAFHIVAEDKDKVVAFLMAMGENQPYRNANYEWFAARYAAFLYIDRVVVDEAYAGKGIGSMLYQHLFESARSYQTPIIACEYNLIPPNMPSKHFHDKMGFREAGQQWLEDGAKQVSMQILELG